MSHDSLQRRRLSIHQAPQFHPFIQPYRGGLWSSTCSTTCPTTRSVSSARATYPCSPRPCCHWPNSPTRARAPALLSHLLLLPPCLLSSIAKSWSSVRHSPKLSLSLSSSSVCSLLSRSPLCLGTVPRRAHTYAASLLQPLVSQWQPLWRLLLLPKLTSLRESASSSPRSIRSGLRGYGSTAFRLDSIFVPIVPQISHAVAGIFFFLCLVVVMCESFVSDLSCYNGIVVVWCMELWSVCTGKVKLLRQAVLCRFLL